MSMVIDAEKVLLGYRPPYTGVDPDVIGIEPSEDLLEEINGLEEAIAELGFNRSTMTPDQRMLAVAIVVERYYLLSDYGGPHGSAITEPCTEVIVKLADGCTLRSGCSTDDYIAGEYVRLVDADGITEIVYWHHDEWRDDPQLVMGAIINSAAGHRIEGGPEGASK